MKIFLKDINECQRGQAFVSGIIFLLFTLLFSIYFLFMAEAYFRNYSNIEKARESILRKSSQVANLINQISINNQNIIASLGIAENAFAEAAEIGLYIGFSQPYWESYGILNQKVLIKDLTSPLKEHTLSFSSRSTLKILYSSLQNQSARGLFLAKSLSEKNRKIIAKLPPKIAKNFIRSSNSDVFCFALETQKKYYQKPGFHHFPILENLYHFYLEKEGCKIKQTRGLLGVLNFTLPLLSSSEANDILSYENFNTILKDVPYGIWYVNPIHAQFFLSSLLFQSRNFVEENNKFTVIAKYLVKIPYFHKLNFNEKTLFSSFSKKISSRITHPYFICSSKNNWSGDFLNENDFQNRTACPLSKGQFIKSFFYPKWTSIISSEEEKNE